MAVSVSTPKPKSEPVIRKTAAEAKPTKAAKATMEKAVVASKESKPVAPKAAPKKAPAAPVSAKKLCCVSMPQEDRDNMIREAAYFKAESRGFIGGDPAQDWLEAEAEVNQKYEFC